MTDAPSFTAQSILVEDGTWDAFVADWKAQCAEVEEDFDDFAPDVLGLFFNVASGHVEQTAIQNTSVCALRDNDGRFWSAVILNWVKHLPGTNLPTVRVRQLTASPRLDFGAEEVEKYAQAMIGTLSGVIAVAQQHFEVRQVKFHLRSPQDVTFFSFLGTAMSRSPMFDRVEIKGAWLYIDLAQGDDVDAQSED